MGNQFTAAELALCLRLHEMGVRPEIREGDWFLATDERDEILLSYHSVVEAVHSCGYVWKREAKILLWSWLRCREWLRERGWYWGDGGGHETDGELWLSFCRICPDETTRNIVGKGTTDLEAILRVVVAVAEEERK
jgi:hypothetical protein